MDSKTKVELFVEEQNVDDKIYRVDRVYAPNSGLDPASIRISISEVFGDIDSNYYRRIHGLNFSKDIIKSYEFFDDKNGSTHENRWAEDNLAYYNEVMDAFDELIKSGRSELTDKSLKFISEVKNAAQKKRAK